MTHTHLTRRGLMLGVAAALGGCTTAEQQAIIEGVLGGVGTTSSGGAGITQAQAAEGLRVALTNGVSAAVATVGRLGGYFNDPQIRIPLPGFLADAQSTLARVGLSGLLDEAEVQLNRAAEIAAPEARSIFVDAITSLTISDAIAIVRGSNTAATDYLERQSTPRLTQLFTPPMQSAVSASGLSRTLASIDSQLRSLPLAPQLGARAEADLVTHGVTFGLDGLFHYIGQEEAAIRANPAKRTSEILRVVFG